MSNIKVRWLGLSCWKLEAGGMSIVVDPYTGVRGLPEFKTEANAVYCSHHHGDHGYTEAVDIVPYEGEPVFNVRTVETYHDGQQGALRGNNLIHIFEAFGFSVVHCGDLGHLLSEEQVKAVGKCDMLLVPIGGHYTIDAEQAKNVALALGAKVIVPMHYREGEMGHDVVAEAEPFMGMWDDRPVMHIDSDTIVLTGGEEPQVVRLTFKGV